MTTGPHALHQFVPLTMARAVTRVVPQILAAGGRVVLDLEDSVRDPFDDRVTARLKSSARATLIDLANRCPELFAGGFTSLRINGAGTPYHAADLQALAAIGSRVALDSVWLPKLESPKDIQALLDVLPPRSHVCPIVETRAGVAGLPEILARVGPRVASVVFGHIDYYLDAAAWPFPRADDADLWEVAGCVIEIVERSERTYIHTAVTEIEDDDLFFRARGMLAHLCRKPFGQISLSLRQTRLGAWPVSPCPLAPRPPSVPSPEERVASARRFIEVFESSRCRNRSFAVDHANGRFLTPHEYVVALGIRAAAAST